ncbi:MAG: acyl-CoA dehydrogenase family protein [Myxococcota bacterium]
MSKNFFTDNDDLRFHLERADWETLVPLVEGVFADDEAPQSASDAKQFYFEILEALGAFAAAEVAPHWQELDEEHPVLEGGEVSDPARMKKVMAGLLELGAMGLTLPRRLGGMNVPMLVNLAFYEVLARADVSCMSHYGFHGGIAQSMLLYSLEEGSIETEGGRVTRTRFDEQARRTATDGEWGAMVLTEPNAGSDLAQIRSTATLGEDGNWRLNGQKSYITSGHGEHHIVLARSEDPATHPGLKGLSLFYCPAHLERDGKRVRNFEIGGLEKKMGQHSAVAATINYEDSEAELIGTRGHGFRGMLLLMNNARIAVGFEALGICEAAYRYAAAYAEERTSMGKPIAQHELIAEYLDDMELSIRGLRAMSFEAAFHEELSSRLKIKLKLDPPESDAERQDIERQIRRHKRRARYYTPLIKYFGGEEAVRITRMCMQILGGIGYIREYPAEKLHRDALVLPVYEGTSQIQALMALKDNMQATIRNPGRFFGELATARIDSMRGDALDKSLARLKSIGHSAQQTVLSRIAADKLGDLAGRPVRELTRAFMRDWDAKKDFSFGLLHAERLTKILTDVAIADCLVRQAHGAKDTSHAEERRELALRWMEKVEPRCRGVLGEIEATSGSLLGRLLSARRRPDHGSQDRERESAA